jgi:hypothetical protein
VSKNNNLNSAIQQTKWEPPQPTEKLRSKRNEDSYSNFSSRQNNNLARNEGSREFSFAKAERSSTTNSLAFGEKPSEKK